MCYGSSLLNSSAYPLYSFSSKITVWYFFLFYPFVELCFYLCLFLSFCSCIAFLISFVYLCSCSSPCIFTIIIINFCWEIPGPPLLWGQFLEFCCILGKDSWFPVMPISLHRCLSIWRSNHLFQIVWNDFGKRTLSLGSGTIMKHAVSPDLAVTGHQVFAGACGSNTRFIVAWCLLWLRHLGSTTSITMCSVVCTVEFHSGCKGSWRP